jgi:hypothetical protein
VYIPASPNATNVRPGIYQRGNQERLQSVKWDVYERPSMSPEETIRNSDIRKTTLKSTYCKSTDVDLMFRFGHLMRTEPSQLPHRAYNNQSGLRARGRPNIQGIDNITDTGGGTGTGLQPQGHTSGPENCPHNAVKGNWGQDN